MCCNIGINNLYQSGKSYQSRNTVSSENFLYSVQTAAHSSTKRLTISLLFIHSLYKIRAFIGAKSKKLSNTNLYLSIFQKCYCKLFYCVACYNGRQGIEKGDFDFEGRRRVQRQRRQCGQPHRGVTEPCSLSMSLITICKRHYVYPIFKTLAFYH